MMKMKTNGRILPNKLGTAPDEAGACAWARKRANISYAFRPCGQFFSKAEERPLIEHNRAQNANLEQAIEAAGCIRGNAPCFQIREPVPPNTVPPVE